MTEAQAVEAITQAFVTGWTAAQPAIPYVLDNEAASTAATWVRFTIVSTVSDQRTIGAAARKFERQAMLSVQLFTPVDAGKAQAAALTDDVRGFLETAHLEVAGDTEPVRTFEVSIASESTDGAWAMRVLTVPCAWWQTR